MNEITQNDWQKLADHPYFSQVSNSNSPVAFVVLTVGAAPPNNVLSESIRLMKWCWKTCENGKRCALHIPLLDVEDMLRLLESAAKAMTLNRQVLPQRIKLLCACCHQTFEGNRTMKYCDQGCREIAERARLLKQVDPVRYPHRYAKLFVHAQRDLKELEVKRNQVRSTFYRRLLNAVMKIRAIRQEYYRERKRFEEQEAILRDLEKLRRM